MGLFGRMKKGISSKANAALDKAIDPEKELDMAILELEEQRRKALQELVSYKATAKQLEQDIEKFKARATEWQRRAEVAVRAGDDEAAKLALKEKRNALVEVIKITRDRDEAASYAIQLNKSRKEFEVKLQVLKLRKGTLAMQIASARSPNADAFGNDSSVWDKFQRAEDRIDAEAIESEVSASMRGEELVKADFDAQLMAASGASPSLLAAGVETDDQLATMKKKVEADRAARQAKALPAPAPAKPEAAKPEAAKPEAAKPEAAKPEAKPEATAAAPATQPEAEDAADADAPDPAAPVSPPIDPAETEALLAKLKAELLGDKQ